MEPVSAFVRARGDERSSGGGGGTERRRARTPSPRGPRAVRGLSQEQGFAWGSWLRRGAASLVVVLAAVALLVPNGVSLVGYSLLAIGSLLVLLGYAAGAYGAFREDFLYGFLYLVFPLYTAYYLVTRWDDLWPWFACSTTGFLLTLLGTELLRGTGAIP